MMENIHVAVLAQLMRCADALENIAAKDGWKPAGCYKMRYFAIGEIDAVRDIFYRHRLANEGKETP